MTSVFELAQRGLLRWGGFSSSRIPTAVGRLHVVEKRERGPLPTVCFLHGLSASSFQYAPLMRRLSPDCWRVLAVDMPAHGLSDVPARGTDYDSLRHGLYEALDRLLAWNGPAVVVGNSMGGFAAVRYARSRPERVRALVLISPGGAPMDREAFARLLDTFRLQTPEEAVQFLNRLFAEPHPLRHLLARPLLRRLNRRELRDLIDAAQHHDLLSPEEVRGLTMPTLFIWGDADRILPPDGRDFFERNLPPHARLERPPHFGHSPQLEMPDELAARIRAFLREVGDAPDQAA